MEASVERESYQSELGRHWEAAGEPVLARGYYLAAARTARDKYARQESERLYRAYLNLITQSSSESVTARIELACDALYIQGRVTDAVNELRQALVEARSLSHRYAEGEALKALSVVARDSGQIAEARALCEEALVVQRAAGDRRGEGMSLTNLATLHFDLGHLDEARGLFEQALAIHRELDRPRATGAVLCNLAMLHHDQGPTEVARSLLGEALEISRSVGDRRIEAFALGNLARYDVDQGRLDDAATLHEMALEIRKEIGDRRNEAITLGNLAGLHLERGAVERGMSLYTKALAIHREVGNRRFEGWTLYCLARVQRRCRGNLEAAQNRVQDAENLFRALGERMWIGCCLCERGHILLAMGGSGRACLDEAEAIARSVGLGENSDLSKAATALARAQDAFDANRALFRGELLTDFREGLRQWLAETGQL